MQTCANLHCEKLASSRCVCRAAHYCGKACQTADWPNHKKGSHAEAMRQQNLARGTTVPPSIGEKTPNAFLIRADEPNLSNMIPMILASIGDCHAESLQLQQVLGWSNVEKCVGEFYDHTGNDTWYYFLWGTRSGSRTENKPMSRACGVKVFGDVVVVRSGPSDSKYSPLLLKEEVIASIHFYNDHDARTVWAAREKSRYCRKHGIDPRMVYHGSKVSAS